MVLKMQLSSGVTILNFTKNNKFFLTKKGVSDMKRVISCILVLSVFTFFFSLGVSAQEPNLSTPGFIIDNHIHYRATDEWEKDFLTVFKEYNAIGCVLVRMNNMERGIKFAKENPDRVIPYAAVDIDNPNVLKDIQKVYDMGYKGLGELPVNQLNYDDPKYDPVWALLKNLVCQSVFILEFVLVAILQE